MSPCLFGPPPAYPGRAEQCSDVCIRDVDALQEAQHRLRITMFNGQQPAIDRADRSSVGTQRSPGSIDQPNGVDNRPVAYRDENFPKGAGKGRTGLAMKPRLEGPQRR